MVVVEEEMDKTGYTSVAQRRTRSGTVKAEKKEEIQYIIMTKDTQCVIVVKEDKSR